MGLIRKVTSASTLGAVKYTSKREAQTKAAIAQARLADAETKRVNAEARRERLTAARDDAQDAPWWRQPTVGDAIRSARQKRD